MSFAAQEFIEHLLRPGLFCGCWGFGGEKEAPGSGSDTRSRTHQVPFMPRDPKGAPPHCAQTALAQGRAAQGREGTELQNPEPSPQQPLPSLAIPSLQPISGRLCEQTGGPVWVRSIHVWSISCLINFATFNPTRGGCRVFLANPLPPRAPQNKATPDSYAEFWKPPRRHISTFNPEFNKPG